MQVCFFSDAHPTVAHRPHLSARIAIHGNRRRQPILGLGNRLLQDLAATVKRQETGVGPVDKLRQGCFAGQRCHYAGEQFCGPTPGCLAIKGQRDLTGRAVDDRRKIGCHDQSIFTTKCIAIFSLDSTFYYRKCHSKILSKIRRCISAHSS